MAKKQTTKKGKSTKAKPKKDKALKIVHPIEKTIKPSTKKEFNPLDAIKINTPIQTNKQDVENVVESPVNIEPVIESPIVTSDCVKPKQSNILKYYWDKFMSLLMK